jgi:hypothetical protein
VNKIQTGTLDVALVKAVTTDADGNATSYESIENGTIAWVAYDSRSNDKIYWEPGATYESEEFYIVNNGNVNLKFNFDAYVLDDASNNYKLSDVISLTALTSPNSINLSYGGVSISGFMTEDIDLLQPITIETIFYGEQTFTEFTLEPGEKVGPIKITGHMSEQAGNEYQGLTSSGVQIVVNATQGTGDEDSFDGVYDSGASIPWNGTVDTEALDNATNEESKTITISTAAELAALAQEVNAGNSYAGYTITLANDLDLNGINWTPIGTGSAPFAGTFDGAGHTISNLSIKTSDINAGFVGVANNANIKNVNFYKASINNTLTSNNGEFATAVVVGRSYPGVTITGVSVDNSSVSGNRRCAGIIGLLYGTVSYCAVTNSVITATPSEENGEYDNGDKVGGIVGLMNGDRGDVYNNTVDNCTITAYRDCGGVAGTFYPGSKDAFKNNSVTDTTIIQDSSKKYSDASANFGKIIGRYLNTSESDVDKSNVALNVVVSLEQENK